MSLVVLILTLLLIPISLIQGWRIRNYLVMSYSLPLLVMAGHYIGLVPDNDVGEAILLFAVMLRLLNGRLNAFIDQLLQRGK